MVVRNLRRLIFLSRQLTAREFFTAVGKHFVQKTLHKDNHSLFCALIVLVDQADKEAPAVRMGSQNRVQASICDRNIWVSLRRNTSDYFIFNQIFIRHDYASLLDEITRCIAASRVNYIIDAGANIGCATLLFRSWFTNARILAIEPEPSNCKCLRENVAQNDLQGVTVVEGALWHRDELLNIDRGFRDGSHSAATVQQAGGTTTLTVDGYAVTTLLRTHGIPFIDLLKMDIEGAEKYLFSDPSCLDAFLPVTRCLAVEVHEEFISEKVVIAAVERYGFTYSRSGEYIIAFNQKFDASAAS